MTDLKDRTKEFLEGIVSNKKNNNQIADIVLTLEAEDFRDNDKSKLEAYAEFIEENPTCIESFRVILHTDAYDNDIRELYVIPEFLKLVGKSFLEHPELIYIIDEQSKLLVLITMLNYVKQYDETKAEILSEYPYIAIEKLKKLGCNINIMQEEKFFKEYMRGFHQIFGR